MTDSSASPSRSALAGRTVEVGGDDPAALRRVRAKLAATLGDALAALDAGEGGASGRIALVVQGLESRGHYPASLLLDELSHAAGAIEGGTAEHSARLGAALREGLRGAVELVSALGAGDPWARHPVRLLDELRAARGAQLASASIPWAPRAEGPPAVATPAGARVDLAPLARRLRPYLQKGLLGWLRDPGDAAALDLLGAVFERLEADAGDAPARQLAGTARAFVEILARGDAPGGLAARRVLGALDRELRVLARAEATPEDGAGPPACLRTMVAWTLESRSGTPLARAVLDALGLDGHDTLVGATEPDGALEHAIALLGAAARALGEPAPDAAAVGAALLEATDILAYLGAGIVRRAVASAAARLAAGAEAGAEIEILVRAVDTLRRRDTSPARDAVADDAFPSALLGDLGRARSVIERMGDTAEAAEQDVPWLPPEFEALLAAPVEELPEEPEPTLEAIDLAVLADRARDLLFDADEEVDATTLAERLRQDGLVLDDEALDNLTAVAGSIGDAQSDLERRVGSLREGLDDMAETITGLRGQVERLGGVERAAPVLAGAAVLDPELAGDLGRRLSALSAGLDELSSMHEAVSRLTRETESLLVRQARDHVELQRGLVRTRLVPVATRRAAWQSAVDAAVEDAPAVAIDGGDARVDQGVLAGVSPVVEALLTRLGAGATPADGRLGVAALVVDGELHLELRGRPGAVDDAEVADAEAAMVELGGRLHRVEGDGSATVILLRAPLTPPLARVLTVESAGEVLAIPLDAVEAVVSRDGDGIEKAEDGTRRVVHAGRDYPLARLDAVLGLAGGAADEPARLNLVFVRTAFGRAALAVDSIRGRGEVITRVLGPQLEAVPWIASACITGGDRPVLVLDPECLRAAVAGNRRR